MALRSLPHRLVPCLNRSIAAVLLAVGLVLPGADNAVAQSAAEKGLAVASEMDRRDTGWSDSRTSARMVLTNAQGDTSVRELRMSQLEGSGPGQGEKSLIVFDRPADVQGAALLTYSRILEPDEQWLYLPAVKRVKRIASGNKSGSFMGSEFAYEDMVSQEVERYTGYEWLRDEPCGSLQCYVISRTPAYENSGYTRHTVWIDQAEYRLQRVDFYDRKDALLKTLTFSDYRRYDNGVWRAHTMTMENHHTGKGTVLEFSDYAFKTGVTDQDFDPSTIRQVR